MGNGDGVKRSGQEGEKGTQVSQERGLEIKVDFYGLRTLTSALQRVAPDLQKELEQKTKEPMDVVRNKARSIVGIADVPSGWKRKSASEWGDRNQKGWDNSKVRNGISVRKNTRSRSGITNLWTLLNGSAAGNIYEFAKVARTPQGVSFVRTIDRQRPSRLIWRAWDESGGDNVLRPAVNRAISEVETKFNQRAAIVQGGDKVGLS